MKQLISSATSRKALLMARAYDHKLRRSILQHLLDKGTEGSTVGDIYQHPKFRIEQSVCSQHLAILRKAGLVNTSREGKYIRYTVNIAALAATEQHLKSLAEINDGGEKQNSTNGAFYTATSLH